MNLASSIILLSSDGNISSLARNSYLSILLDDYADIFPASLLISHCSLSSLILSSVVIIRFYIVSKRFSLKHEELPRATVVLITKKEYGFVVHLL